MKPTYPVYFIVMLDADLGWKLVNCHNGRQHTYSLMGAIKQVKHYRSTSTTPPTRIIVVDTKDDGLTWEAYEHYY